MPYLNKRQQAAVTSLAEAADKLGELGKMVDAQRRVRDKLIARAEVAGLSDAEIARICNMTKQAVSLARKRTADKPPATKGVRVRAVSGGKATQLAEAIERERQAESSEQAAAG